MATKAGEKKPADTSCNGGVFELESYRWRPWTIKIKKMKESSDAPIVIEV
jgi:hypothetical protein